MREFDAHRKSGFNQPVWVTSAITRPVGDSIQAALIRCWDEEIATRNLMTQYWITIAFDDAQMKTLQTAVDHYLEKCRREARKGTTVPLYPTLKRFFANQKKPLKRSLNLFLLDSYLPAVEAALANYLDLCEREIAGGTTVPFVADRETVKKICTRLSDEFKRAMLDVEAEWAARQKSDR